MKTYNINISILAKVEDDKLQTLQERLDSACQLALLGWSDVEDRVIDIRESEDEDSDDERLFSCTWTEPYYPNDHKVVGYDFFTNGDNGYDDDDLYEKINKLDVCQACRIGIGGHIITRIK